MPLVPSHVASLAPYAPGKPIEEAEREHGVRGLAQLASNENPLGPSPKALAAAREAAARVNLYLFEAMLREGVVVRPMVAYGFPSAQRVTVGVRADNERCLGALRKVLGR